MHDDALMHSKRAERLMKQSIQLYREKSKDAPAYRETIAKAVELNRKAVEESKRSMRTMDFLVRYKRSVQARKETA